MPPRHFELPETLERPPAKGVPALASAKAYFEEAEKNGRDSEEARAAVRWFFRAARKSGDRESEVGGREGDKRALNAERRTTSNEGRLGTASPPSLAGGVVQVEDAPAVIEPEKADLGATPWERKLVERLRVGHYQRRTETTYREGTLNVESPELNDEC